MNIEGIWRKFTMLEMREDYNKLEYTMVLWHMRKEIHLSISVNRVYGLGWKLLVCENIYSTVLSDVSGIWNAWKWSCYTLYTSRWKPVYITSVHKCPPLFKSLNNCIETVIFSRGMYAKTYCKISVQIIGEYVQYHKTRLS